MRNVSALCVTVWMTGLEAEASGGVEAGRYVFRALELTGGRESAGRCVNNLGAVAGVWTHQGSAYAGFIWQDGELVDIGVLPGDTDVWLRDMNDRGEVVGWSQNWHVRERHGFRWSDGGIAALGGESEAIAVNNRGQIVGRFVTDLGKSSAGLWDEEAWEALPGDLGRAINDDGTILWTTGWLEETTSWLFGGVGEPIQAGDVGCLAIDMSSGGTVVGSRVIRTGEYSVVGQAFRWSAGRLELLWVDEETVSGHPWAVNDGGVIVGTVVREDEWGRWDEAAMWIGEDMLVLNDLVEKWWLKTARDVNDCGEIVGIARGPDVLDRAFLLRPNALADFSRFTDCMAGPGGGRGFCCHIVDEDYDGDVDLADFAVIQRRAE